MAARPSTLTLGDSIRAEAGFLRAKFATATIHLRYGDGLLTMLITGVAIAFVVRPGEHVDLSAAALAGVGALALAWRRNAPMAVFLISALAFCVYQTLGYPHQALPFAVLIALYTVAARSSAVIAACAAIALILGAVGTDLIRKGGPPPDLDDLVFVYFLSGCAACALGYAVQLGRARTELLRDQAATLTSSHAAHEQEVLRHERARIARELHDVVAHQVSVVTALAAGARRVFSTEPQLAREALNSIELAGREALTEMRRLLRVLRADADQGGLVPQPGLEHLPALVTHTENAGLPVQLVVQGQPQSLPVGVELCAYRIVQEALTNALKHAGPSRATVLLSYTETFLELHICDDGRGMPADVIASHGLIGMHERAAMVGGWLHVGARPSGGVEVLGWLPAHAEPT
ncbi:MAG: hypothetical protein JWR06_906 [Jatrophihabitans sp.]|jgi:signal transduction histidine kinase|nr:hypothetical protein [Jatrophihabitans sp.]MDT4905630.1 hypothetical protein [Pseudonocardiales bacterium]MDT4928155.1 hypothetical protein [Pseudonocardiales bacterium]MDT4948508.1 hypothetical protein [Pseudonocardiales bacterium]